MTEQPDKFILDKNIWTHDDFEQMGWHDANIYGLIIQESEANQTADFVLDIDYIFKWVYPMPPAQTFTFWIAPCTLIFKECFDLHIDFNTGWLDLMEIADLHLESKIEQGTSKTVCEWTIELQQGRISLKSCGFEQIVRRKPIHVKRQSLSLEERGGINFGRTSY